MQAIIDNLISGTPRAFARVFALCALFLLSIPTTYAAIYSCERADGSVVYQDTACAVIKKVEKTKYKVIDTIPFGIEKTWFDTPPVVPDRAVCTKDGCHCDLFSREYRNGLALAIADSLYIDGSWHRLDSKMIEIEQPNLNSFDLADLQNERDEAACNILMSQKTLRMFGRDTLRELRNKKRYAEDRGLDNPEDCDAGDTLVCEYTDLIALYDRIQSDIRALSRTARVEDETTSKPDDDKSKPSQFADRFLP